MKETTNNEIYFETIEELKEQVVKDRACEEGLEWLDKQKSLQEVFEKIDFYYRLWCLCRGYVQFSKFCDWGRLNGENWASLLSDQPQFANHCDWEKLNGDHWSWLLRYQPQFANKCNLEKLNGDSWSLLLIKQPQFSNKCDWKKLNSDNWSDLLYEQPQLSKYKLVN